MNECPYCGGNEYYTKDRVYGMPDCYPGDDNGEVNAIEHSKPITRWYCASCGGRVFLVAQDGEPI